jgi:hypothetical protein
MEGIIAFVRSIVNDVSPTDPSVTDQWIQDRLDLNRRDVYAVELTAADTITTGGVVEWHDFYAPTYYWEDGYLIQGPSWNELTPDTNEPMIGRWTFVETQQLPLYITGRYYDVYGVAAQVLSQMEAQLQCTIGFTADGLTVNRAEQLQNIRTLRSTVQKQAWTRVVKLRRRDMR